MNKKIGYLAAAFAVAGAAAMLLGQSAPASHATGAAPVPEVTVAKALLRNVDDSASFTGHLQATDTVDVRPRVSGYVDEIAFTEGATVSKGQLLFRIDPRPYKAESDRLGADLRQAQAEAKLAEANADRGRRLLAQNAVASEEAQRLDTAAQSALARVASARAALDTATLNLGFTEVRAPIDGRVSNARITAGNLVSPGDVLTSVVSIDPIYAYFDVDEQSYLKLQRLRVGAGGAPSVAMALADETGYPHAGRIDFVDNQLSRGSGTIRLRAVFANANAFYTPGLYIRMQLHSGNRQPRLLIDDGAIGTDLGNKFVYVVGADHKASYRKVDTGPMFGGLRVISTGLKAGEQVVINGLQRVQPGIEVKSLDVPMDAHLSAQDKAQLATAAAPVGPIAQAARR